MKTQNRLIKFKLYYQSQLFGFEWLDQSGWHNYSIDLDTDKDGNVLRNHPGVVRDFYVEGELIRAQFTGILDKNNREIYEGDIIKYSYESISLTEKIIFSKRWCSFMIGGEYAMEKSASNLIEIIGNIFENPEINQDKV
jgi:hypothetical protein